MSRTHALSFGHRVQLPLQVFSNLVHEFEGVQVIRACDTGRGKQNKTDISCALSNNQSRGNCSKNSYVLPLKPKEFSPTHQAGFFCQNALGRGSQVIFYSNIGLHLLGSGQQLDCNKKNINLCSSFFTFFSHSFGAIAGREQSGLGCLGQGMSHVLFVQHWVQVSPVRQTPVLCHTKNNIQQMLFTTTT